MDSNNNLWLFTCFFLFLKSSSLVQSSNATTESLDVLLHDHAYKALLLRHHHQPRTGALYDASIPASLAGMKLSVVRLRTRTLWQKGANFSRFHIPAKTLPVPYVRRIVLVYHDLGNWSSVYFNLSGYSLITPVVGFTAYDPTNNLSSLELNTTGEPISIRFKNFKNFKNFERTKCAIFNDRGEVLLSSTDILNVCYARGPGHFSIVVGNEKKRRKRRRMKEWFLGMIGFGLGVVGLGMAGLVGKICVGIFRGKKMWEMEKEREEGESMGTFWIDKNSRMPRASNTRTHPVLENPSL